MITPTPIDHERMKACEERIDNAGELLASATAAWDHALQVGEKNGYRNAQVSVIAPTGTIGLLMDCDTTGVEPDFALVKFKKLAGGGYFKIANASLEPALRSLGYEEEQVRDIMRYVLGALTLDVPLPSSEGQRRDSGETLAAFLKRKGLTKKEIETIADALPSVFELSFALGAWTIGDAALERLGIDAAKAKDDPGFNLLRRLGLTWEQIDTLNEIICGAQTVEGAPHLKDEHLAVFDCATTCGKKGTRSIRPEGHIRMMAAAQPFISGAISKTINLPSEASVEDIKGAYRLSWELGLKANALYRDGCKLSQVLSSKSDSSFRDEEDESGVEDAAGRGVAEAELRVLNADEDDEAVEAAQEEVAGRLASLAQRVGEGRAEAAEKERVHIVHRPMRRRLPDTRRSLTHKFSIAGHEGYLTVGLYEDGRPGELFVTMAKEGSTIGGLMDSLGTATSVALQYGVPIESLVRKFAHQRFEPAGMTLNQDIPFAKSLVDYIFRWMGMQFVEGYRDMTAPQRGGDAESSDDAGAETRRARLGIEPRHQKARQQVVERKPDATVKGESAANGGSRAHGGGPQRRSGDSGETLPSPTSTLSEAMRDCQSDAPACEVCGEITVRNGACYRCLNCGHSMGCS
jgi:ribonucleoside-diphosphate reductase alpha chain